MTKPSLYSPPHCLLALLACALLPMAARAQQAAVAAAAPTPALSVAPPNPEAAPAPPDAPPAPPATAGTTETEILATEGATFASKDRIAVFTGEVRVTDPRFKLACDKLTVFLNKTAPAPTPGAAATPPPLAAGNKPPADPNNSGGGIDHALAEGHVVIVQERAAVEGGEAKRSVGRGESAAFDNKTGDMVLRGTPSVEQNQNTHVATSPKTVMTLKRDNSLTTIGPSRTMIIQRGGDAEFPGSNLGAPATGQPAKVKKPKTPAPPAATSPAPTASARS